MTNPTSAWRANLIYAALIIASTAQTAQAQSVPPSATWSLAPNIGTCTRCGNWNWLDKDGAACQSFTCLGPDWPNCANKTPTERICTPGQQFSVTGCGVTGVEQCTYTCNAQGAGYSPPACTAIGNGGNFRRSFCDYSAAAGCGVQGGFVQGRPTTLNQQCTQDGVLQTVTRGSCGEGGCSRRLVCKPGQPCCRVGIDPGCSQCTWNNQHIDLQPKCGQGGSGYQCTFGKVTVSMPLPCPNVTRKPFPRAIVGQPVSMQIVNGCADLPSASNRVDVGPPYDQCGDTIFAYEGQIAWICSSPELADAEWSMDERAWNIGQRNAGGLILDQRTGGSITHIYETSSYDKAPIGPGPDPAVRQPAYQVRLTTHYNLVGAFRYHYRTQEHRCYWGPDQTGGQKQCHDPGACLSDPNAANREDCKPDGSAATVIVSPTRELPTFIIGNIAVDGARTPQDPANPNTCGVIGIPVVQAQSVLGGGNK